MIVDSFPLHNYSWIPECLVKGQIWDKWTIVHSGSLKMYAGFPIGDVSWDVCKCFQVWVGPWVFPVPPGGGGGGGLGISGEWSGGPGGCSGFYPGILGPILPPWVRSGRLLHGKMVCHKKCHGGHCLLRHCVGRWCIVGQRVVPRWTQDRQDS